MTNNHPHPNPKEVEAWMVSLGFTSSLFHWHLSQKGLIVSPEEATFFYTIHHTALTSFRDELLEKVVREDGALWACDDLHPDAYKVQPIIQKEQRKAIQTISGKYGL